MKYFFFFFFSFTSLFLRLLLPLFKPSNAFLLQTTTSLNNNNNHNNQPFFFTKSSSVLNRRRRTHPFVVVGQHQHQLLLLQVNNFEFDESSSSSGGSDIINNNNNINNDNNRPIIKLKPCISTGLQTEEIDFILSNLMVEDEDEDSGLSFELVIVNDMDDDSSSSLLIIEEPITDDDVICCESAVVVPPGVLGRVLLFDLLLNEEEEEESSLPYYDEDEIAAEISARIDQLLFSSNNNQQQQQQQQQQPVFIAVQKTDGRSTTSSSDSGVKVVANLIQKEVTRYMLRVPIDSSSSCCDEINETIVPSAFVKIDGAMVTNPATQEEIWDTSSIVVFDGIVDYKLRSDLLKVVQGQKQDSTSSSIPWDDIENGPDPLRWVRDGLDDTVMTSEEGNNRISTQSSSCWGLPEEAIEDLCFNQHTALKEFESRLTKLFPRFHICRLPEMVLGECVSPLTANAPTNGDVFNYHIDADPNMAPPSPWTDIFGRYPNRIQGKPRFVSCLVYLNDYWEEDFGAPTQFFDPPTGETYEVQPRPGRVVLMDQDIMHTVVAPNQSAGNRPRYSLVWKLIFHPKEINQSMNLIGEDTDGNDVSPLLVGSANKFDIDNKIN